MDERADAHTLEVDLLARMQSRDPSALADIAHAYGSHLRHLVRRLLGSDHDAIESIVDDALLAVWTSYDPVRGSIRGFLFKVARHKVIDELRRARRAAPPGNSQHPLSLADEIRGTSSDHTDPAAYPVNDETRRSLDVAMEELTDRERRAVHARFRAAPGDAWARELEKETGQSARAWRKSSDDAKQKLKASLARQGITIEESGAGYELASAKTSA